MLYSFSCYVNFTYDYRFYMKTKDFEGVKVKITGGDRDWVGTECTIKNVKDNGDCEVHSIYSFYTSNVKHIQINPDEKWNTNGHDMVLLGIAEDAAKRNEAAKSKTINNDTSFWLDAQEFLKGQLPEDFQDKLIEYAVKKGYNQNEFRLFSYMLEEAVGFHGTMVVLKHYQS